ncbi:MAG TPA: hypothetical protein VIB39_21515 [Candidatus Angelobacter sp.]
MNGRMACEGCTEQIRQRLPQDSHAAYVRGLIFGIGAMLVGLVFYAGFTIVTRVEIGIVSLAVGLLIGKAMMMGSNGVGGRRYQITAVVLTYAAVSLAAIPIVLFSRPEPSSSAPAVQSEQQPPADGQAAPRGNSGAEPKAKMSFAAALLLWIGIGLASPFLELQNPGSGVIGLIILFVGIRIAWRLTQGRGSANIEGPYDNTVAASGMR